MAEWLSVISLVFSFAALLMSGITAWNRRRKIFIDDEDNEFCIRVSKETRNAFIEEADHRMQDRIRPK